MATHRQWKQAMEGQARGLLPPLQRRNLIDGLNSIVEFSDQTGEVVMRMRVIGCLTDKPGQDCERVFTISPDIIAATSFIYIPTEAEYEAWGEIDNGTGTDHTSAMIAAREV